MVQPAPDIQLVAGDLTVTLEPSRGGGITAFDCGGFGIFVSRATDPSPLGLADTPGTWAPIFLQHPDGTPIPGDWAEGFFDAIKLSIDAWAPFMADLETAKHLTMILVYCGDNEGQNLLPIPPELRDQILGTAHRLIPESVIAIRAACMPARVAQAKADAAPNRRKSPR